jgi:hypothetical protein
MNVFIGVLISVSMIVFAIIIANKKGGLYDHEDRKKDSENIDRLRELADWDRLKRKD